MPIDTKPAPDASGVTSLLAAYALLALFFLCFVIVHWTLNYGTPAGEWPRAGTAVSLGVAALCILPLLLKLVGPHLRRLKFFDVEVEFQLAEPPAGQRSDLVVSDDIAQPDSLQVNDSRILPMVQQITARAENAAIMSIDLHDGHYWWPSRLFLVTQLLVDRSRVEQLLFVQAPDGERQTPVAMIAPVDLRAGLVKRFPILSQAWAAALSSALANAPQPDLWMLVNGFATELKKRLGPRPELELLQPGVQEFVSDRMLAEFGAWPSAQCSYEWPDVELPPRTIQTILSMPAPFVALTRQGEVWRILRRSELALTIAVTSLAGSAPRTRTVAAERPV